MRFGVILFIILVLSIAIAQAQEMPICTTTSDQTSPTIYGSLIVYDDMRNGNADIYMYNLSNSVETRITTDPTDQVTPTIYGDIIVWSDYRNGATNTDIYYYNLSSQMEYPLITASSPQHRPIIDGTRVVWRDNRNGGSDIYMYDFATATEYPVEVSGAVVAYPRIDGDIIVWDDARNGNYDIYMYNISSSTETRITTDSANQEGPAVYGNIIVWTDYRWGNNSIFIYNLSNGLEILISTGTATKWYSSIYGNNVVWHDGRNGNLDIYIYSLSTGTETQITDNTAEQSKVDIVGNKIVWQDMRNGNYDIYMYELNDTGGGNTPPIIYILDPESKTYNTSSVPFNITAEDPDEVDTVWFNIEGDNMDYFPPIILDLTNGSYILRAYANDTLGFENMAMLSFSVNTSPSQCFPNWVQDINPCIDNTMLITYTDTNSCGSTSGLPSNNGTYVPCSNEVVNFSLVQTRNDNDLLGPFFRGIAILDIDRNNYWDFVAGGYDHGTRGSRVYRNDRNGYYTIFQFLDKTQKYDTDSTAGIAVGDIDNDGDIDIFESNTQGSFPQYIHKNDGKGIFYQSQQMPEVGYSGGGQLGDIDSDGDLDLVMSGGDVSPEVFDGRIYLNNGSGFFLFYSNISRNISEIDVTVDAQLADFDGDGYPDIITQSGNSGGGPKTPDGIFLNDGNGNFYLHSKIPFVFNYEGQIGISDFDADSDMDIIRIFEPGTPSQIYKNNGSGIFTLYSNLSDSAMWARSVSIADADNDGDNDLAVSYTTQGPNAKNVVVYTNDGNGNFAKAYETQEAETTTQVRLLDIDNDGRLDFVVGSYPGSIRIYKNTMTSTNTQPSPPAVFSSSYSDGKLTLSWNPGSDTETPENLLMYNLKVGTKPHGQEIVSGVYGTPMKGNMHQRRSITLNIPEEDYYWEVQTIDSGLKASEWSQKQLYDSKKVNHKKFKNSESTDFDDYDESELQNMTNVTIGKPKKGKIDFDKNKINASDSNLDGFVIITTHNVTVEAGAIPQFNKSALIRVDDIPFKTPRIKRDGQDCGAAMCKKLNYSNGVMWFSVGSFSSYTIEESSYAPIIFTNYTQRLTNNEEHSADPSIASDSFGNSHVVWTEARDGNNEIYYMRIDSNGNPFSPVRITSTSTDSSFPAIKADSSDNLHLAWQEDRRIYYKKLDNNGGSLTGDIAVSSSTTSILPSLDLDQLGNVHIVWSDDRNGDYEIYYRKFDNNGNPLTAEIRITTSTEDSNTPDIAVDSSNNLHLAWSDERDGNSEIYYKKLDNSGSFLTGDIMLTDEGNSLNPVIDVDSSGLCHIAWNDDRDENQEIYYIKLDNGGSPLIEQKRVTYNNADSDYPDIKTKPGKVMISWSDTRNGDSEVYYKELDDLGDELTSDLRVSDRQGNSLEPSMAIGTDNIFYLAWYDNADGNNEIYHSIVNVELVITTPTDNLIINSDTTLAPGIYNLDDVDGDGVLIINADNVVLDCNGAEIIGSGNGHGIYGTGEIDQYWKDITNNFEDLGPILDDMQGFIDSTDFMENVEIRNCKISNYESGINLTAFKNLDLYGNELYNSKNGISSFSNYLSSIHNNEIHDNGNGIFSLGIKENSIYNNHAYNNNVGITAIGFYDNIFSNNASGNTQDGIMVIWSNGTEISNNIANNNANGGINLAEMTGVKAYDNIANYNKDGIKLGGLFSQGTTKLINISNNTIANNSRAGIVLSSSTLSRVIELKMAKKSSKGHHINNSYITYNNLENTGSAYDFGIVDGTGSHIYNNTIIQNNFNGKGVYDVHAGNNDYCAGVGNSYGAEASVAPGDCFGNTAPVATILAPADGSEFTDGTEVNFIGEGMDAEDGALTGTSLKWSSDVDGCCLYGENINYIFPSPGPRIVTLTAVDSFGAEGSYSINVDVTP